METHRVLAAVKARPGKPHDAAGSSWWSTQKLTGHSVIFAVLARQEATEVYGVSRYTGKQRTRPAPTLCARCHHISARAPLCTRPSVVFACIRP